MVAEAAGVSGQESEYLTGAFLADIEIVQSQCDLCLVWLLEVLVIAEVVAGLGRQCVEGNTLEFVGIVGVPGNGKHAFVTEHEFHGAA